MTKQTKTTAKQPTGIAPRLRNFYKNHKILTLFIFTALVITVVMGIAKYNNQQQRFSDKDYAAITAVVDEIFTEVGGEEVAKNKSCKYAAPEKFGNIALFCAIEMVAYLPYESDEQAITVAENFEKQITSRLGKHFYGLSRFYEKPHDGHAVTTVTLEKPFPEEQCNFYIDSGEKAKDAVDFLPKKTEDNLIALSFECSAESKEEYFPITFRQG